MGRIQQKLDKVISILCIVVAICSFFYLKGNEMGISVKSNIPIETQFIDKSINSFLDTMFSDYISQEDKDSLKDIIKKYSDSIEWEELISCLETNNEEDFQEYIEQNFSKYDAQKVEFILNKANEQRKKEKKWEKTE